MRGRGTQAIYLASYLLIQATLSGCEPPTDGAPVEVEAVANPVPEVNPQGMIRSASEKIEE